MINCLIFADSGGDGALQIASLEENGTVNIWVSFFFLYKGFASLSVIGLCLERFTDLLRMAYPLKCFGITIFLI